MRKTIGRGALDGMPIYAAPKPNEVTPERLPEAEAVIGAACRVVEVWRHLGEIPQETVAKAEAELKAAVEAFQTKR